MITAGQQSFLFTAPAARPRGRQNIVIEAGAGTGKTTAIVAEVLRLLLGDENLHPERIVLVTFTEKAAGEIADRVHSALTEIDLQFDADAATIAWPIGSEQPLFDVPAAQREHYRRACAKQLARIDKLRSQTIHSFCQNLLRQHAIDAGMDPQFRVIEGFERAHFYSEVYDAWLDHETRVSPTPETIAQWEVLLDHADYLFLARNMIFSLVDRRDLLLDSEYTLGEIGEMETDLLGALKLLRASTADTPIVHYVRTTAPPQSGSSIDAWIEFFAPIAPAIRTEKLRNDGTKAAMKVLRCGDIGSSIYDVLVSHRAAVALLSLTRRFLARADAEKRAQGVVDFDDLLLQTMKLLDNDDVVERVRQQFDYVFVDEFQDTDRIQARIIDRLGRDSRGRYVAGKTIVVGDPKQSIYGFRRADPELYAATTKRLIDGGAEPRALTAQYRSEPALLDAINAIAAKVLEGGDRDPNVFRPEFRSLAAARKPQHADDAPVTLLLCEADDGESRFTREAEGIADWIANAPDYRRYALLFRRLTQIDAYLDVFDARGIPYVLPPTRQFLDRPAPVDLLAVLRAVAYPTDRGAEISAARTPYFALTDDEIVARGEAYRDYVAAVDALRAEARHLTVTELIDRVVGATNIEEVYALCADAGRARRHLEHLRAIAFAYDQSAGGSVRQFVDEISHRRDEPDEVEPALFDETRNAVRILTVHGAKGLEFETVILPDLTFGSRGMELFTVDEPHSLVMHGRIESISGYARKSGERCLHELGGLREDAEARRLFYVAITRAKRDLAFVCVKGAYKKGFSKYLQEALPYDASMWPEEPCRIVTSLNGVNVALERTASRAVVATRRKLTIDVPSQLAPLACGSLLPPSYPTRRRQAAAIQAGILLHRVLERWDGVSDIAALLPMLADEQAADAEVMKRVERRLAVIAKSPMLTRIANAETIGRELPISILDEQGAVVSKRIDRVIREANIDIVIDYKSGTPQPEHREQITHYCAAMERLTGRPHRGVLWYIDEEHDAAIEV